MRSSALAAAIALAPLALSAAAAHAAGAPCNPLAYGAVGDGVTDNTAAIQSAIDGCVAAFGGGVVILSVQNGKGTYLSGPIRLASHIKLQIDKGATLLGTADHSKYHIAFSNYPYHANEALVSAYQAVDIGIIGPGTIDGQGGMPAADGGPSWWQLTQPAGATTDGITWYAAPYADIPISNGVPRPWLVEFYQCNEVAVNDLTLTNAPASNLVLRYSSHITVSELTVTVTPDPQIPNTDGIDVIGSSGMTLIFLNIASGGDSIALKSGLPIAGNPNEAGLPQLSTHEVQIVNSKFSNGNGIVVGGEAVNGVYNVLANNITGTNLRHGLVIRSDRIGGNQATGVYNIWAQNMNLTGVTQPLAIGDPSATAEPPHPVTPTTPNIHDVTVKNVIATGATEANFIAGLPEACIRNVVLENVSIADLRLRNMTGTFTNAKIPAAIVQDNVTVTTAGTTPAITNTPWQPSCSANP